MFWEADNAASKRSDLTLTFRPRPAGLAPATMWLPLGHPRYDISASRAPAGSDELWLLKGHNPSHISRHTCYVADPNYPFGIIRQNERRLSVRIDISVRDPYRSLWTICSALSANGNLDRKIDRVEMAGWTNISFHALVMLIVECLNYPHLKARIAAGEFIWCEGYSVHMRQLARVFCRDIFQVGAWNQGIDNAPYIAWRVWKYLNPQLDQPLGVPPVATWQWDDRRTFRSWMNHGFFQSHTWEEALQRS